MASSGYTKLSKEEYRKLKDLEAARKAGTAPAELDDEGKEINPHIPQYMVSAPWYIDNGRPTLKHQRATKVKPIYASIDEERKLKVVDESAVKYRKGACENCGSMTHKKRDCVERPRKIGAKYTNKNIRPDEVKYEPLLDYDGKRDRWHGYNVDQYFENPRFTEYIEREKAKNNHKKQDNSIKYSNKEDNIIDKLDHTTTSDNDNNCYDSSSDEKYADKMEVRGQTADIRTRTIYKNLRVREDTAKYLRNLEVDSAFYDPKTRSMRSNPYKDKQPPEDAEYFGDNFVRYSGDSGKVMNLQLFAWQNYSQAINNKNKKNNTNLEENGAISSQPNISILGNPTLGELKYKEYNNKQKATRNSIKQSILDKYGGAEHLVSNINDQNIIPLQTEAYVEYCAVTGKILKGKEPLKPRSKYEEDVFINNHTSVFGSFWENGKWGYKCCHSFIKGSYCVPINISISSDH